MLALRIIKGPNEQGREQESFGIPEGRSTVLGRSENCQIRLASSGISKKHCVITPISTSRVEVEDLGSSNGTYINGLLVKKHIMQPGDTLSVHHYVLQLTKQIPKMPAEEVPSYGADFAANAESIDAESSHRPVGLADKFSQWLEDAVYPNADRLAEKVDVRLLTVCALAIWTLIITTLSLNPFKERANMRVREESIQVAKLYARQLVSLNSRAIIEQRYKDLIGDLDSIRGQTPGVIDAMIVDVINGQILAPPERLGQTLGDSARYVPAKVSLGRDKPYVELDEESGVAWVSAPIKIGTSSGDKTVATALVEYSYLDGQFTINNLIDQIVNSLVYALALSLLFLVFVYRWLDGSVRRLALATENSLRDGDLAIDLDIEWPSLETLKQEITFCLTKASEGGGGGAASKSEWAQAAVQNTTGAAAAFDDEMKITAWNEDMEQITGIQANIAMNADISEASRDIAFESAVRELSSEAMMMPWTPQSRKIEFSGRYYKISMVSGGGGFLLNIDEEGDD